jgi:tricarballylate dehydrogenase
VSTERDLDVLVLGAGLAGMSAALTAAASGARTLVVERAPTIGGSAAISGGYVWAIPDAGALRAEDPGEFQRHGHVVVAGYRSAIEWLRGFTAPLTGEQRSLAGRGHKFDMPLLIAHLMRHLATAGGNVLLEAEVADASHSGGRYVLDVATPAGRVTLRSRCLVLATGGRQGDPTARAALAGGAYLPPLRANPWSRGTGAALASAFGASTNLANKGFYGHLYPSGVHAVSPVDFITFALYHSAESVMVDSAGARFADESRGDHNNAMALAERGCRAALLWSAEVQQRAAAAPFVPGSPQLDRWAFSRDRGGRVTTGESLTAVADVVRGWGYDVARLADDRDAMARLGQGRLFAAEVEPAVTFTFGGIEVNDSGAAVDGAGRLVPGLFAAGADMSDVYHRGYGGGLCLAVVSGRRAGALAAESARVPTSAVHVAQ